MKKYNRKLYQYNGSGSTALRIWRSGPEKSGVKLTVKCGDCQNKIEIFFGTAQSDDLVEIGGVVASIKEWRKIFDEVLRIKRPRSRKKRLK